MVAVAFALNYIMGTGFLTLPWTFYKAGIGAGIVIVALTSAVSSIAVFFILETIARGEMLEEHDVSVSGKIQTSTMYRSYRAIIAEEQASIPDSPIPTSNFIVQRDDYVVDELKIEIPELCELFLGMNGRRLYTTLVSVYAYGTLWAFSTVFANAFATHLPLYGAGFYLSYGFYLIVFGSIVVPASCMELREQVTFQVVLAWGRVLMVVLMLGTTVAAYISGENPFRLSDAARHDPSSNESYEHPFFVIDKLYLLIPVAMYANIFHHAIPSLSEPVRDKSQLGSIYATSLFCCFLAYSAMSVVICLYFGPDTRSSSNLNWRAYDQDKVQGKLISFFIVLFPALDVASAFPLNAITLGNNLMSFYYREQMHFVEGFRLNRVRFRVIASLPSVIAALFITDISMITNYTGLTGFVMALIFPALLSFYSRRKLLQLGLPTNTRYSSILTSTFSSIFTIVFSVSLIVFVLYSLTSQNFSPFAGPT